MISVNEAKRLIKRTLLANIVSDKPNSFFIKSWCRINYHFQEIICSLLLLKLIFYSARIWGVKNLKRLL